MLANHLKIALRQFRQEKLQFTLNVGGLVVALTAFFLILFYVQDEYSYDRWLPDADRLFRYETETSNAAGTTRLLRGSVLRAKRDLETYFSEIEAATRLTNYRGVLERDSRRYFETLWFADASFFDVFALPLAAGNHENALADKYSIVLSQTMAEKYFPNEDPLGANLTLDGERIYRITGVFRDIPENSHFAFDFLLPYDETDPEYGFGYSESWFAFEGYTYLKLAPTASAALVNSQLQQFLATHFPADALPAGTSVEERLRPRLQSVTGIHLSRGGINNIKPPGNPNLLWLFTGVAVLILGIATVNFISMSVNRSLQRTREVAIRKVVGAGPQHLFSQFMCESVLIALLATIAALGLLELLLPIYNEFLDKQMRVDYFSGPTLLLVGVVLVLVGLASNFLPAQRLAALHPVQALKQQGNQPRSATSLIRSSLLAFQFAVAITLVISTLVVVLQQQLIASLELGFDAQNKLVLRNMNEEFVQAQRTVLAQEIENLPSVTGVTFSTATPGDTVGAAFTRRVTTPGLGDEGVLLYPKSVGPDYFSLYGIEVLAGREFQHDIQSDRFFWDESSGTNTTPGAIVNETAVRALGFSSTREALGKTLTINAVELQIVGTVADAHFLSLRNEMTPNLYLYAPQDHIALTIAYADTENMEQLLSTVAATWDRFVPEFPATLDIVENKLAGLYREERLQLLLMTLFSTLAIAMTSVGLYALVSQMLQQRRKEIGIRKIHGALALQIVRALSARFTLPLLIACVIAWPSAWYFSVYYLQGFQYRIEPGLLLFLFSSFAAITLTASTIVGKTYEAATRNPVDALRS